MRIGERAFECVALARQQPPECVEIDLEDLDAARIERTNRLLTAKNVQRRPPLRSRLGQQQRSVGKIERRETDFSGDFSAGGQPPKSACDHQMDDDEEVALERDHDSFADAADGLHFMAFELRWSGLDRAEDERARKSHTRQWLTDDA